LLILLGKFDDLRVNDLVPIIIFHAKSELLRTKIKNFVLCNKNINIEVYHYIPLCIDYNYITMQK